MSIQILDWWEISDLCTEKTSKEPDSKQTNQWKNRERNRLCLDESMKKTKKERTLWLLASLQPLDQIETKWILNDEAGV